MRSVELFSGCGGLALGVSRSGFKHSAMIEWDKDACATVEHNKLSGVEHIREWPIECRDVRSVDWSELKDGVDLVTGGPPCQPFSIGGKHKGMEDGRDMWPEAIRSVRELRPKAFLFENVRGLLRPAFADYLEYIRLNLSAPDNVRNGPEPFMDHLDRLRRHEGDGAYHVRIFPVNAADYGVAQKRHRVIIIGIRKDLAVEPTMPTQTHSRERLLWDQWVTGQYWKTRNLRMPAGGPRSAIDRRTVEKMKKTDVFPEGEAWLTCRDAFAGLGEPDANFDVTNHVFQPGAKVYPGHTGSPIDEPAKALKAGDHGVPGGENMVVLRDGSVRYFTVREAARLQGMPDEIEFPGSWTETMRQLGNAVPTTLALKVVNHIRESIYTPHAKGRAAA